MLAGTKFNLAALDGVSTEFDIDDGQRIVNSAIEFMIVFKSGRLYFTGGYEEVETLRRSISDAKEIHGSYHSGDVPWQNAFLSASSIETIIDLRHDTATESEGE